MEKGNILEGVRGLIGNVSNSFSVLEEEIDIDLQFEYFKQAKQQRAERRKTQKEDGEYVSEDVDNIQTRLYNDEVELDNKKKLLVELAASNDVKAYRTLEQYRIDAPSELQHWTTLAMQESKMHLESSLLDESQVFISTGMGGKGDKLRYSAAFRTITGDSLTETQQSVICNEVEFALQDNEGELENIRFEDEYAIVKALVPMSKDVNQLFKQSIVAANDLGEFLQDNFIVTNVKDFTLEKLRKFEKNEGNEEGEIPLELPFDVSGNMQDMINEIKKVISQKLKEINLDEPHKGADQKKDHDEDGEPED